MLDVLQDPNWPRIGFFVTLLIALTLLVALVSGLGWYIRGRKQGQEVQNRFSSQAPSISSVRRVARQSMEERAHRLLTAIYDLAEGNPEQWIVGASSGESGHTFHHAGLRPIISLPEAVGIDNHRQSRP